MFWEGFRDVGWMLETLTLYLSTVNRSWPTNTMWTEDENFLGHRRPRGHNSTQISSDHHISLIVQLFLKTFFASFTFVLLAICGLKYVGWRYLNVGVCNIEFIWTKVTKTTQVHWAVSLKCRKRLFCSILRTFLQKSSYFSILAWQIGHFRHIFIICCNTRHLMKLQSGVSTDAMKLKSLSVWRKQFIHTDDWTAVTAVTWPPQSGLSFTHHFWLLKH